MDIDDNACAEMMWHHRLATKSEAVNLALRTLVAEHTSLDDAHAMRGTGWRATLTRYA